MNWKSEIRDVLSKTCRRKEASNRFKIEPPCAGSYRFHTGFLNLDDVNP